LVPILALLMFLSSYTRLGQCATQLWVAFVRGDLAHVQFLAGRVALLGGEVVIVLISRHLLERLVSKFFLLGTMLADVYAI